LELPERNGKFTYFVDSSLTEKMGMHPILNLKMNNTDSKKTQMTLKRYKNKLLQHLKNLPFPFSRVAEPSKIEDLGQFMSENFIWLGHNGNFF